MADVIVVGAGAAGLFAAGTAQRLGHTVTVIEHMTTPGKKLLITGKGRCNVTNNCDEETFLQNICRNPRFLYSAVYSMPPSAVMELFEDTLNVPLKTERGRRVFPQSDSAQDILDALLKYAKNSTMIKGSVTALLCEDGKISGCSLGDKRKINADAVIVATGGLSYPKTGSTGIGYSLAKQVGHNIIEPYPSLVSLVEKGSICKKMMGLSLRNVKITLLENDKAVFSDQGELLFTHFGLSGPLVLSASAYIDDLEKYTYEVSIDLKPALSIETLDARLQRDFLEMSSRIAAHSLDKILPSSMRSVALEKWGIDQNKKVNQITKEERQNLASLIKDFRIRIGQRGDLEHAVITAGGVDVKKINPKTMESKLVEGLYFAGEVLDVHGYTGGYNLQIAWSTAYAAATALQ